MDYERVSILLQKYWYFITLIVGVIFLIGAIMNWNWLCNPTGAPHSHRYGRRSRRFIFFLLGIIMIAVSIWGFVLVLKS